LYKLHVLLAAELERSFINQHVTLGFTLQNVNVTVTVTGYAA